MSAVELPRYSAIASALVDAKQLAEHLGFRDARTVLRLARSRTIPSIPVPNGNRTYYRFRISEVEEALKGKA